MKQLFEKLRVEDWTAVWMALPLLALAILCPERIPNVP